MKITSYYFRIIFEELKLKNCLYFLMYINFLPKSIPSETFPRATESSTAPLPFSQAYKRIRQNKKIYLCFCYTKKEYIKM